MKTIYIDFEFKCHVTYDSTLNPVVTDFFDGKCSAFIEGYRFLPSGESWTRSDGVVFHGEMISPWQPYTELAAAQAQYESDMAELQNAYREGVDSV